MKVANFMVSKKQYYQGSIYKRYFFMNMSNFTEYTNPQQDNDNSIQNILTSYKEALLVTIQNLK